MLTLEQFLSALVQKQIIYFLVLADSDKFDTICLDNINVKCNSYNVEEREDLCRVSVNLNIYRERKQVVVKFYKDGDMYGQDDVAFTDVDEFVLFGQKEIKRRIDLMQLNMQMKLCKDLNLSLEKKTALGIREIIED